MSERLPLAESDELILRLKQVTAHAVELSVAEERDEQGVVLLKRFIDGRLD